MNYYVESKKELVSEMAFRQSHHEEISGKVDEFVFEEWGIAEFSALADDFLGEYSGFMSRQIPTVSIESVMVKIVADMLGVSFADMLYPNDTFIIRNDYKKSLISRPIITGCKKNTPIINRECITEYPPDGTLLNQIFLPNNKSLIDFHREQRLNVFGDEVPGEVLLGKFFQRCLQLAEKKPDYVYELDGNQAIKKSINEADLTRSRPAADWYYPLYFLLFTRRFLFESYEGAGDKRITEAFRKSMELIFKKIGIVPLVVRIPAGTRMLYVNPTLHSNNWKQRVQVSQKDDLFEALNNVSDQLISLGVN